MNNQLDFWPLEQNKNKEIIENVYNVNKFKDIVFNYFRTNVSVLTNKISLSLLPKEIKINKLLNTEYSECAEILGIENNFQINKENMIYEIVINKYKDYIKKSFNIVKLDESYYISFKGVIHADKSKAELIDKILMPKIQNLIKSSLLVTDYIKIKTENENIYKIVNKFSKKHNISNEVVYLALQQSDTLINKYKGVDIVLKHKNEIINSVEKYETILKNNFYVLKETISLIKSVKKEIESLSIEDKYKKEIIERINSKTIYQEGLNNKFTYKEIEEKIDLLINNKEFNQAVKKQKI